LATAKLWFAKRQQITLRECCCQEIVIFQVDVWSPESITRTQKVCASYIADNKLLKCMQNGAERFSLSAQILAIEIGILRQSDLSSQCAVAKIVTRRLAIL
jgi:hypothetical protein